MSRQPIFNVPGIVLALIAILGAVHAGLSMLGGDEERALLALAFIPARYAGHAGQLPGGELAAWTSFVTHQLVHGDLQHLAINGVWLLAFGSAIARRVGAVRLVLFAVLCGIGGAALFLAVQWGAAVPMVGASGAISGLMAAGFRLLLPAIDADMVDVMRNHPRALPLLPLRWALRSRRVLIASSAFVALNFALAFAAPLITDAGGIAWEAHLGGFFVGFLLLGLFDPPRPAREANLA